VAKVQLPKDKSALADVLKEAVDRAKSYRNPLSIEWQVNYWWMQGVRHFTITSYQSGRVMPSFESSDGKLNFRYEDALDKYQRELGRILRIQTRPKARRKALGLESVRKAAVAQVVLDHIVGDLDTESTDMALCEGLLMYGTMGIATWVDKSPGVFLDVEMEVVPPWQILPIPAKCTIAKDRSALIRHRSVPLKWLKEVRPKFKYPKDATQLEIEYVPIGEKTSDDDEADIYGTGVGGTTTAKEQSSTTQRKYDDAEEPYVELVEAWVHSKRGRLDRYIAMAGRAILEDTDYAGWPSNKKPVMPMEIVRHHHSGGFWGRSFLGPLIPVNQETEKMLGNLFKNVQELDNFGFMLLPATWGVKKEHLKSTARPKVIFYEPDYTAPTLKADRFQPTNTGDFPGRVASMGNQIMDRLSRESPMYSGQAAGRMDSASGHGLLMETANIPIVPVGTSIAMGYVNAYRVILQRARELLDDTSMLELAVIDDHVAGVSIDGATGGMALDDNNPIPDPDEVWLDIMEREPKAKDERKQELQGLMQMQVIDPVDFWWINHKEDLGFPEGIGAKAIVDSILTCMYRNIVQWNDGKNPQEVVTSPHDRHIIHKRVLEAFMARPTFSLASEEVRDMFYARKKWHDAALGGFPEGVPKPEEAAEMWGSAGPQGPLPQGMQQALEEAQ